MLVMGLVLAQSLMAISTTGMLLYAKVFLLYNVLWECIVVVYTQTTLFTNILTGHCTLGHRTLLVYKISDLYLLRFLRYRDSLKNKNDNDNDKKKMIWRNRLFAISPMFVVQFSPNFRCTYILTLASGLSLKVKV